MWAHRSIPDPLTLAFVLALCGCFTAFSLRAHDHDVPELENGGFEEAFEQGWWLYVNEGSAEAAAQRDETIKHEGSASLRVDVRRPGAPHHVQLIQGGLPLVKGQRLIVRFWARSVAPNTTMRVSVMRNSAPWGGLGLAQEVKIQPEWREYALACTVSEDNDDGRLDFMPRGTLWLDDVRFEAAPEGQRAMVKGAYAVPDNGWLRNPRAAVDGKLESAAGTAGYPFLPAYLVVDLGRPKTVVSVRVIATDRERTNKLRSFRIDVSEEGEGWYVLGEGKARGLPNESNTKEWEFGCPGYRLRYVALRIEGVGNIAQIREVEVFSAVDVPSVSPEMLTPVPETDFVQCLGPDWDAVGYRISRSEGIPLRLRSIHPARRPLVGTLHGELTDSAGRIRGDWALPVALAGGGSEIQTIELPDAVASGKCLLRTHLTVGDASGADEVWSFFVDPVAQMGDFPPLRVAMDLDAIDPEGVGKLLLGPWRWEVEHIRRIGAETQVAVVTGEAPSESVAAARSALLRELLERGGSVLFYGKVTEAFADLLPVIMDIETPFDVTPQRVTEFAEDHPAFAGLKASDWQHAYWCRATPKPGATVLARTEGGLPVVVESTISKGQVFYVAAGMFTQALVQPFGFEGNLLHIRLLLAAAGHGELVEPIMRRVCGAGPGLISERNTGRFGWRAVGAGLLTANIGHDLRILATGKGARPVRVAFGANVEAHDGLQPTVRCRQVNWLAKTLDCSLGGASWEVVASLGSPVILHESSETTAVLDIPGASLIAIPTRDGVRCLPLEIPDSGEANLPIPEENWVLLWYGNAGDSKDAALPEHPVLVVLSRRPSRLFATGQLAVSRRLVAEFSASPVAVGLTFPDGVVGVPSPIAKKWLVDGLPSETLAACRRWARAGLAIPISCVEEHHVEADGVRLSNRFGWRMVETDYSVTPQRLAPLPPLVPFVAAKGLPLVLPEGLVNVRCPTRYGELFVVPDVDEVSYSLPAAVGDHLGYVCPQGFEALRESMSEHFVLGDGATQHSSGGFTTHTPYVEDLREYQKSGGKDFAADCIDLYKWLYGFGSVLARPMMTQAAQEALDARLRTRYWRTINFYQHKSFVRWRTEPFTGHDYLVTFIWPTNWQNGTRYFTDQNESSALILYCLWAYAQYTGDWDTIRANWSFVRALGVYLERVHDWALMASFNREEGATVGIDMLNSEYPGMIALARMAEVVGDEAVGDKALALAAKASVPILARRWFPEYLQDLARRGNPEWEKLPYVFSFRTNGIAGRKALVGHGIKRDFAIRIGAGYYDTSKGTSPEIVGLYRRFAPAPTAFYEQCIEAERLPADIRAGYNHLFMRRLLGWPREELVSLVKQADERYKKKWWFSIHYPNMIGGTIYDASGLFLCEWAPLRYESGAVNAPANTAELVLEPRRAMEKPVRVRLWSSRVVTDVRHNGQELSGWRFEKDTGYLRLMLPGNARSNVTLTLGQASSAPRHPYYWPTAKPVGWTKAGGGVR